MIFSKHRFEIWNQIQHPLKHSLSDFAYSNPALPGVTNAESALNWMFAAFYPNTKPAVANPAALPLVGNSIGDYRVVLDDGDGKAASYRWEQREGEVAPSWHKIYDMDWGQDSILAAFTDATQDLYVWVNGRTQLDGSGSPIVGLYAGQRIFGGNVAGQNLTLAANSGDGVGPTTGYVQVEDNFRPTTDAIFELGTPTERWFNLYLSNSLEIANQMYIDGTEISNSTGTITFANTSLTAILNLTADGFGAFAGNLTAGNGTAKQTIIGDNGTYSSFTTNTGRFVFNAPIQVPGILSSGSVDATQLLLTDPTTLNTLLIVPDEGSLGNSATVTTSLSTLIFNSTNPGYNVNIQGVLNVDDTVSSLHLIVQEDITANAGSGFDLVIFNDGNDPTLVSATGNVVFPGQNVNASYFWGSSGGTFGNIDITGSQILANNFNGDIYLAPNGTGSLYLAARNLPAIGGTLGNATNIFSNFFINGLISNGTNSIAINTLLSFRSGVWRDLGQTIPAQAGDTLFWDAVNNVWLANHPDTEITHSELTGLAVGDSGHTQFAMLLGRAGGQTLNGGNAAGENLILGSTSHATKGVIYVRESVLPLTNASFSGSWSGTDLGDATHYFRDLYTKGELKGARLENFTSGTLPGFSGQNVGRVMWATDVNKAYVDTGIAVKAISISKFISDEAFDGVQLTKNVTVSSEVSDARNCLWQLRDNLNNFEVLNVKISTPNAATVTITTTIPLPVGSYRLIGVE